MIVFPLLMSESFPVMGALPQFMSVSRRFMGECSLLEGAHPDYDRFPSAYERIFSCYERSSAIYERFPQVYGRMFLSNGRPSGL
jgi:hypothetical protein